MAEDPEVTVLREALRQAERVLEYQDHERQSVLRRAGELLRLSIATLGGVIVITGILSAVSLVVDAVAFAAFAVAVILQVLAAGLFAALLAGGRTGGDFSFGPDARRIATHLQEAIPPPRGFLVGLVIVQPDWIEENHELLKRMQRVTATGTMLLASGTLALLTTLLYILGGLILA